LIVFVFNSLGMEYVNFVPLKIVFSKIVYMFVYVAVYVYLMQ